MFDQYIYLIYALDFYIKYIFLYIKNIYYIYIYNIFGNFTCVCILVQFNMNLSITNIYSVTCLIQIAFQILWPV